MKKIILISFIGFLFTLTGCNEKPSDLTVSYEEPSIETEKEKLKLFLENKDEFTCTYREPSNADFCELVSTTNRTNQHVNDDDFINNRSIYFGDLLIIQENRLHVLRSSNDDRITQTSVDIFYVPRNGEINADITVTTTDIIDGERDDQTTTEVLSADYDNNDFTVLWTLLTDEEVEDIKEVTLKDIESTKEVWDEFFNQANVDKDVLF